MPHFEEKTPKTDNTLEKGEKMVHMGYTVGDKKRLYLRSATIALFLHLVEQFIQQPVLEPMQ